jgi:hypothetical protein
VGSGEEACCRRSASTVIGWGATWPTGAEVEAEGRWVNDAEAEEDAVCLSEGAGEGCEAGKGWRSADLVGVAWGLE